MTLAINKVDEHDFITQWAGKGEVDTIKAIEGSHINCLAVATRQGTLIIKVST